MVVHVFSREARAYYDLEKLWALRGSFDEELRKAAAESAKGEESKADEREDDVDITRGISPRPARAQAEEIAAKARKAVPKARKARSSRGNKKH